MSTAVSRCEICRRCPVMSWPIGRYSLAAGCPALELPSHLGSTFCTVHVWSRFVRFWRWNEIKLKLEKNVLNYEFHAFCGSNIPFERFRCEIEQRIGIQLQPVSLPWCDSRFPSIFDHSLSSNAAFHHWVVGVQRWVIVLYDVIAVRFKIGNRCNACTVRATADATVANDAFTTFGRQLIGRSTAAATRTDRWFIAH